MVIPFLLLGNLTLRDFKALIQRHAKDRELQQKIPGQAKA
jgi:hypothetical protein